jgi:arsenate reductase
MQPRLFHNPRCSKSRAALQLLTDAEVSFETYLYLKEGLKPALINQLCKLLSVSSPWEFMRHKEPVIKELGLSKDSSKKELVAAIAKHPILLERPIFVSGDKAVIGRPPENVLAFLINTT